MAVNLRAQQSEYPFDHCFGIDSLLFQNFLSCKFSGGGVTLHLEVFPSRRSASWKFKV
jgi:hypothetical protein